MKHLSAIILSLVLCAAAAVAAHGAGAVSFASQAGVSGARVSLLDLAVRGDALPQPVQKRLAAQKVCASPRRGAKRTISGLTLRTLVRRAKLPQGYSVLIPAKVVIHRKMMIVSAGQLSEFYRQALIQRLGHRADNVDIHNINTSRELKLPAGKLSHVVNFFTNSLSGRVPANITISVDGRRMAQVRVTAQVDVYREVVVAAHTLPRRQIIGPGDLKMVRMNIAGLSGDPAGDIKDVAGMRPRANVPAGEPLLLNQLERAPLVRRGDVVTMICQGKGLKITAKGKAEQTGYKNSRIRLLNLASKREVYGKVLDSGTVLVRF